MSNTYIHFNFGSCLLKILNLEEEVSKRVTISSIVFFSSLKLNTRQIISLAIKHQEN